MTYKIYIDKKGVPKWNPKWPIKSTLPYYMAMRKAKSEAVEFEDLSIEKPLLWDCFMNMEIDGSIEIQNGKAVIIPKEETEEEIWIELLYMAGFDLFSRMLHMEKFTSKFKISRR